ncbi:collagenase [Paenibacillus sp. KN14-4R]|uniref:collagenase n=1 Tax=Paenibacillus sp. KN14-4R TaxID=3445773 RepID=UPI003F9FC068
MKWFKRKSRVGIVFTIIAFIVSNSMGTAIQAQSPDVAPTTYQIDQTKQGSSQSNAKPLGKLEKPKSTDQSIHDIDDASAGGDRSDLAPEAPQPYELSLNHSTVPNSGTAQKQIRSLSTIEVRSYSMAELNDMAFDDLIATIQQLTWTDIPELFRFNADTAEFYGDRDRMDALFTGLEKAGNEFTQDDKKGINTLVEVLRSGYYLGYYNSQLGYINKWNYRMKVLPAVKAIENNPNFQVGTEAQNSVIASVGLLIGNTAVDAEVINKATKILNQIESNFHTFNNGTGKEFSAAYELVKGINFILNEVLNEQNVPKIPDYVGKFDSFLAAVGQLSLHNDYTESNNWFLNNAIYYVGKLSAFNSNPSASNDVLTKDMEMFPKFSYAYMQAASSIAIAFKGIDSRGNAIRYDQLVKAAKSFYFPNRYTFDDGQMVMYTGKDVTEDKVKRLYWASKEVRAQFYRVFGNDEPLEKNHADDILTMFIYNTKKEYAINLLLNGIETENGGIYIEGEGTFYTWERTPEISIYTLEELFRHEFTHFLQGRYLVPGLWGKSEIYRNDRVTWLEEGGAELFAGSTRENEILPRKSMSERNLYDPVDKWMQANEVVHAKYDGFRFYTFAYQLQYYIYKNHPEVLERIAQLVRANDGARYDSYMNELGRDAQLNDNYINSAVDLHAKAGRNELTIPLVADDYVQPQPSKPRSEIFNEIAQHTGLSNIVPEVHSSTFFNTFAVRGTYKGGASQGIIADRKIMDGIVNQYLKTLDTLSWSGYKTVTAYYVNYRLDENNQYVFDVVLHGLLPNESNDTTIPPTIDIHGPYEGTNGYPVMFTSKGTFSPNGTITSYEWDFGDGTTSTLPSPPHVYRTTGVYQVTLKVTNSHGITQVKTTTADIGPLTKEMKPNGTFQTANGPLPLNVNFPASMEQSDSSSYFYFELDRVDTINLLVTQTNGMDLTWTLYKDSEFNQYWQYSRKNGNKLEHTFDAPPGRYYLCVYKNSNSQTNVGDYKIKVTIGDEIPVLTSVKMIGPKTVVIPNGRSRKSVQYDAQVYDQHDVVIADENINWKLKDPVRGVTFQPVTHTIAVDPTASDPSFTLIASAAKDQAILKEQEVKLIHDITEEIKPNQSFETATGPLSFGVTVSATLDIPSNLDYYYFEVPIATQVNVSAANPMGIAMQWVLRSDKDIHTDLAQASGTGSKLSKSIMLDPGTYYVIASKSTGTDSVPYQLIVTSDPIISTIVIEGKDVITIPDSGSTSGSYQAFVLDQNGTTVPDKMSSLKWKLKAPVTGVSIHADTGELTVGSSAVNGEAIIIATSEISPTIAQSKMIIIKNVVRAEEKPNGSYETATGPLASGVPVAGGFNPAQGSNYFYFDSDTTQKILVNINVPADATGSTWNWVATHESNRNEYLPTLWIPGTPLSVSGYFIAKPGRNYVSAYQYTALTRPFTLTVTSQPDPVPNAASIAGANAIAIPVDQDVQVTYTVTIQDQFNQEMKNELVRWTLSQPAAGVSIDEWTGIVTVSKSASAGNLTVVATPENNHQARATKTVMLSKVTNEPMTVKVTGPSQLTIPANGSINADYTAQVLDQNSAVMPGETVVWSLQGAGSGISVDPSTGRVTLTNTATAGTFQLVATSASNSNVHASITVTLTKANGSYETAVALTSGVPVSGMFDPAQSSNYYYFDVATTQKVLVHLDVPGDDTGSTRNWVAVHESNHDEYLTNVWIPGTPLSVSGYFIAKPGRNYVSAYQYTALTRPFTLTVTSQPDPVPNAASIAGMNAIAIPEDQDVKVTYTVTIQDQFNQEMKNELVRWTLSQPAAGVSIDEWSGVVTVSKSASAGNLTIVATPENNHQARATKTVTLSKVSNVTMTVKVTGQSQLTLPESGSINADYTAQVLDQFGVIMPDETVKWSLQGAGSGISVEPSTGRVTLTNTVTAGTFQLVATSSSNSNVHASITVTLTKEVPSSIVTKVVVTGSSQLTIPENGSINADYTAQVLDQNSAVMPGETVVWSLQGAGSGISVEPSTGRVTIANTATAGTFQLVATSSSNPNAHTSITITLTKEVIPSVITNVTLTGPLQLTIPENGSINADYRAQVLDQYGAVMPGETVIWNQQGACSGISVEPSTGRVTLTNTVTAGTFQLVATSASNSNVHASITVTLTKEVPSSIVTKVAVTGASQLTIPESSSINADYTAQVLDQYGAVMPGETVVWSLQGAGNGINVDQSAGRVTIANTATAGTFQLVATSASNSNVHASKTVTLTKEVPSSIVTNVTVTGQSQLTIPESGSINADYTAQVLDQYGAVMPGETVIWSLQGAGSGISVDQSTGRVTVTNKAKASTIKLVATSQHNQDIRFEFAIKLLVKQIDNNPDSPNPPQIDVKVPQQPPQQPQGPKVVISKSGNNVNVLYEQPVSGKMVMDDNVIRKALKLIAENPGITTISFMLQTTRADKADVIISAKFILELKNELPNGSLIFLFNDRTISLPMKNVSEQELRNALDSPINQIFVSIGAKAISEADSSKIRQKMKKEGLEVIDLVSDSQVVFYSTNGKTKTVNGIGGSLFMDREVDPAKTTVLLFNPVTNEISFVPATFQYVNGQTLLSVKGNVEDILIIAQNSKTFIDIQNHWAQADIELLASKRILSGITDITFQPDEQVTRAQFVTMLFRSLGLQIVTSGEARTFTDVSDNDWYAKNVRMAARAGIISGFEDGTFRPDAPITREEIAVMILNVFHNVQQTNRNSTSGSTSKFQDRDTISSWAQQAVAELVEQGIVAGITEDSFAPSENATRAQSATLLKRILQYLHDIN